MKRLVALLALLLVAGCSTPVEKPKPVDGNDGPKQQQPAVSEEAAVKAAKSADPRAGVEGWATWKVRLVENTWVVEASHADGERLTIYVDAKTYPPKVLRVDKAADHYISQEKAIEVALAGSKDLEVSKAEFIEQFRDDNPLQGGRILPVWRVELVAKADKRPQSRVLVDAITGKVISVSNPPSGY